jgi:hypothetical protein
MPLRGDSSLDCKEARELTRGFLSGGGMLERRAEWRAHLAACKDCDAQYRETVELLSRLHRARRDAPEEEAGSARATEAGGEALPGRRSLIAFSPPRTPSPWRPRKRAGWLGMAIPFAALLVLGVFGLPGKEPRAANVLALQGAVGIDDQLLGPGDPARPLARGSMIVAGAAARARLQDSASELVLEGEGALRCEGFAPLRVFLHGGRIEAQGACTISTALGVVQSPAGALRLSLEQDGLHLRAGAAGACFLDVSGRRAFAPGEEWTLATPAPVAPR